MHVREEFKGEPQGVCSGVINRRGLVYLRIVDSAGVCVFVPLMSLEGGKEGVAKPMFFNSMRILVQEEFGSSN